MANQLVAAPGKGGDQLGAVVIERRVDQFAGGQGQLVEQFQAAPGADAVAVFTPAVVQYIELRRGGADSGAQAFGECEMLKVKADVDRQPGPVGPAVVRPRRDGALVKATAVGQGCQELHCRVPTRGRPGCAHSPARSSSHSALSFHTAICTMRPERTT
jgi:hypothetical protein